MGNGALSPADAVPELDHHHQPNGASTYPSSSRHHQDPPTVPVARWRDCPVPAALSRAGGKCPGRTSRKGSVLKSWHARKTSSALCCRAASIAADPRGLHKMKGRRAGGPGGLRLGGDRWGLGGLNDRRFRSLERPYARRAPMLTCPARGMALAVWLQPCPANRYRARHRCGEHGSIPETHLSKALADRAST